MNLHQQQQHTYLPMERSAAAAAAGGSSSYPITITPDDIPENDITSDFDPLAELMSGFESPDFSPYPIPCLSPVTETQLSFPSSPPLTAQLCTMRDRLSYALKQIIESQPGRELLVQIWVPTTIGDRKVLTTIGQPYQLDSSSARLTNYRSVSKGFYFAADGEGSEQALGLPGRVFVGRVPEWTPDVRLFEEFEYPRVGHARSYDIKGSVALPIFPRGSGNCLGVIELITTARKIHYGSEIDSICNALQAVDLRSTEVVQVPPWLKLTDTSYELAVPDLRNVLRSVCEAHNLPLAQTWIPCIQHGKYSPRHSHENYTQCISTVDSASYVQDETFLPFHQSCSDHHLLKGEGVAGRAFLTNKPCFAPDVTNFSKIEYPLAHHAKLFNLHAAVAVRLRHICTGRVDFVLEFFLPVDCIDHGLQRSMLDYLSLTIQQNCRGLRGITEKELEEEGNFGTYSVMESPVKDDHQQQVFSVTNGWDSSTDKINISELDFAEDVSVKEEVDFNVQFIDRSGFMNRDGTTERKRTKAEKSISLEELRKHFAGSLKDAAKNLGVCPTTLKRICRQHGISRWPSRKIKKVSHSLQKLQMVIDSVHGPEGGVQLSSIYDNLTKSVWTEKDSKESTSSSAEKQTNTNISPNCNVAFNNSTSNSSSSCSQNSNASLNNLKKEISFEENVNLCNARTPVSGPLLSNEVSSETQNINKHDSIKVKVINGEERVVFRLQLNSGFEGLKQEVARRFGLADLGSFDLKYLDDESEWVLLTCDADLHECIDVYKSSTAQAIRISVFPSHHRCQDFMPGSFNHLR